MKSKETKKPAAKKAAKKPETYQDRVKEEKKQLDEKRVGLNKFLKGDEFTTLDPENQALLLEQSAIMTDYSAILDRRIDLFK